jgi:hypothetical protein
VARLAALSSSSIIGIWWGLGSLVVRLFKSSLDRIGAMSDVNFVKVFAQSIERLRRGEIAGLRLVGFAEATPERRGFCRSRSPEGSPNGAIAVLRSPNPLF